MRRLFALALLAAALAPGAAMAQQSGDPPRAEEQAPQLIEPDNALEHAFVQALSNREMRPIFRRRLLESPVALALASDAEDSEPREFNVAEGVTASFLFTSTERLNSVLGPNAPRVVLEGREALELLRGKNVALNPGLVPMLTLEPEDVADYLETPAASAGPAQ